MLTRLDSDVRSVVPIDGVSVGTMGDSSTVRIDFRPEATEQQRAAAQAVVDGFDWSEAAQAAWERQRATEDAGAVLLTSARADHVAIRACDVAEWTYGRNDVAELNSARWALLYTALNLTPPTQAALAAQIELNRALAPVDPAAPAAAGVADRGGRRLNEAEILALIAGVLAAGGGLPPG